MAINYQQYFTGLQNPLDKAIASYEAGKGGAQKDAQLMLSLQKAKAQQVKAQQAKALREELYNVSTKEYSSPEEELNEYQGVITRNPMLADHFKSITSKLSDDVKSNNAAKALGVYAALQSGMPDRAKKLLSADKEAAENSGDKQQAAMMQSLIDMIDMGNPEAAKSGAALYVSYAMGPEKAVENYTKLQEELRKQSGTEGYRVLSTEEKKKFGLDAKKQFQISTQGEDKGKISQIGGTRSKVEVNLAEQPKFGKIPQGMMLMENEDGSYYMKPVPGSPEEIERQEKEEKKGKRESEQAKYGNIVIEDIKRLREKIKSSSFYDPVLGVGGALASRAGVPGSARIDAEELKTTIVANLGFDRLQQMKESSPSGGALGAISERELSNLQAVLGSLSLSQSEDQLIKNLDRLEEVYSGILKKAAAYPNAAEFGFSAGQQQTKKNVKKRKYWQYAE